MHNSQCMHWQKQVKFHILWNFNLIMRIRDKCFAAEKNGTIVMPSQKSTVWSQKKIKLNRTIYIRGAESPLPVPLQLRYLKRLPASTLPKVGHRYLNEIGSPKLLFVPSISRIFPSIPEIVPLIQDVSSWWRVFRVYSISWIKLFRWRQKGTEFCKKIIKTYLLERILLKF